MEKVFIFEVISLDLTTRRSCLIMSPNYVKALEEAHDLLRTEQMKGFKYLSLNLSPTLNDLEETN